MRGVIPGHWLQGLVLLKVQHHMQALVHLRVEEVVPGIGEKEVLPMGRGAGGEGKGREGGMVRGRGGRGVESQG